tara:strand:- start:15761 stop:16615 length:855 start_codon:yes stop_codon:yes gene_type:complete
MILSTLVSDIYEKLELLSEGQPLPISEEEIDHTVEAIRACLISWAKPPEKPPGFTVRMSNVGKPDRQLWYEKNDKDINGAIDGPTQIKFLYGHLLEEIVLMLVRMSGHKVTDEQKEIVVNGITGHMDCKIDGEVVDIKTASRFAFNKFKEGKLLEDDPFGYLGQLAGYEAAEGTENGGFLVINKESGELCMYIPDDLDKPNIQNKITKLLKSLKSETKPDFCYPQVPDGKKGNMKLSKGCAWCKYKHDCYKDCNDGVGLRTFKYSNGLTFLTEVVSEPKVEELL